MAIQTIDRCNAECIMCPYVDLDHSAPPIRMSDEMFEKIARDLHGAGTLHTMCLMLQNEPLLDRRLSTRVQCAREVFGNSLQLVLVTHGELLTPDRIDQLDGFNRIEVSIDAATPETHARIRKGLDYETVVANTEALIAHGGFEVAVKFVVQRDNEHEVERFRRHWKERGAAVSIDRLCNRAGTLDAFERIWAPRPGLVRRAAQHALDRLIPCCPLPFSTAYVRADGRVVICSHDWEPKDVVGDLSRGSILDFWNCDTINHYRHLLWTDQTQDSQVCRDCSLAGRFWRW